MAARVLGEDHDETLKIKSALANALVGQRRYDKAEALFVDVIARRRRLFGDDDSSVQTAVNNLSGLYHAENRHEDSARLDEEVLEIRRRTLREDHPREAMNNLAYSLMVVGRHDQAKVPLDRAIRLGEKVWGLTHPQYGLLLHTRGELAAAMGDLDLAEVSLARALETYDEKGYASYRPLVLYELAQVSARLGKAEPAVDFLARALDLGYEPEASAPAFTDDPQLAPLRDHPRFQALASAARARRGK